MKKEKEDQKWRLKLLLSTSIKINKNKHTKISDIFHINKYIIENKFLNRTQNHNNLNLRRKALKNSETEKDIWEKEKLRLGKQIFHKMRKKCIFTKKSRKKSLDIFDLKEKQNKDYFDDPFSYNKRFYEYAKSNKNLLDNDLNFYSDLTSQKNIKKNYLYYRSYSNSKNKLEINNVILPPYQKMFYILYIKWFLTRFDKIEIPVWKNLQNKDFESLDKNVKKFLSKKKKDLGNIKKTMRINLKFLNCNKRSTIYGINTASKKLLQEYFPSLKKRYSQAPMNGSGLEKLSSKKNKSKLPENKNVFVIKKKNHKININKNPPRINILERSYLSSVKTKISSNLEKNSKNNVFFGISNFYLKTDGNRNEKDYIFSSNNISSQKSLMKKYSESNNIF